MKGPDLGHPLDLRAQLHDGAAVADQRGVAGSRRGLQAGAAPEHGPAVRMAEGVCQAHRVDRGGMVVAQVFDNQVAAGRVFEVARLEHADPLDIAVTAQESIDFGGPVQFAVVHQQADEVAVVTQLASGFGQAGHAAYVPVMHRLAQQAVSRIGAGGNA
jgi:hypothetical protein